MDKNNHLVESEGVSEVILSYRTRINPKERALITSSMDAYQILFRNWNKNLIEYVEEFKIILLNRSHRVLGFGNLSRGTTTGSLVDIKHILQFAVKTNSCGIIIAHNHPSGNPSPSDSDKTITRKIRDACKLLDITLLDHIIILPIDGYYSFADDGIL